MSSRPAPAPIPPAAHSLDVAVPARVLVPRLRGWLVFTIAVVAAFLLLIFSRTALDRTGRSTSSPTLHLASMLGIQTQCTTTLKTHSTPATLNGRQWVC